MPSLDDAKPAARNYALAVFACALTAGMAMPLRPLFDLANIVMLFLLTVFLVALRLGRGPAILAAFLSVVLFDVLFVPPRFSLEVANAQYLLTFAVMLTVGLITAHLTADLRRRARAAHEREVQAHSLYELARELAGLIANEQVAEALDRYLGASACRGELHLLDRQGNIPSLAHDALSLRLALTAIAQGELAEMDEMAEEEGVPARGFRFFVPLNGPMRVRGVMIVSARRERRDGDRQLFSTVASLVALTVERLHYVEVAHATQMEINAERLRNSVLSALSHDMRTPLTALVGLADSLVMTRDPMSEGGRATAAAIRDSARAMSHMLSNLLDMARLQAGKFQLRREWQLFEDVVSASLNLLRPILEGRPVQVDLPPDLPLVEFDAVLLERVVCNLLENAAKYSPAGSPIEIRAFIEGPWAGIAVSDRGSGFPAGETERVFGMFERGVAESATPGVGLGLAICRAIVEAHGGTIAAANRPDGGACVTFRLPAGTPPAIEEEPPEDQEENEARP